MGTCIDGSWQLGVQYDCYDALVGDPPCPAEVPAAGGDCILHDFCTDHFPTCDYDDCSASGVSTLATCTTDGWVLTPNVCDPDAGG